MKKDRKVYVHFSNGFGNNIFQFSAAKLLGTYHGCEVVMIPPFKGYYGLPFLKKTDIDIVEKINIDEHYKINDSNFIKAFDKMYTKDFLLTGFFEDYRYYFKYKNLINSWLPEYENVNNNDLVFHFRGTDRLVYKNEFAFKPKAESYVKAIEKFDFDKMHIISGMPKWDHITKEDLENMTFHLEVPKEKCVPLEDAVGYFNSIVDAIDKYRPTFTKRDVHDDFNFIRGSNNILFEHGTLSWWGAFLSNAKKVGVYGPWRAWKGKRNKNLSQIPLKTWFKWE